jgi:hypothetical protein
MISSAEPTSEATPSAEPTVITLSELTAEPTVITLSELTAEPTSKMISSAEPTVITLSELTAEPTSKMISSSEPTSEATTSSEPTSEATTSSEPTSEATTSSEPTSERVVDYVTPEENNAWIAEEETLARLVNKGDYMTPADTDEAITANPVDDLEWNDVFNEFNAILNPFSANEKWKKKFPNFGPVRQYIVSHPVVAATIAGCLGLLYIHFDYLSDEIIFGYYGYFRVAYFENRPLWYPELITIEDAKRHYYTWGKQMMHDKFMNPWYQDHWYKNEGWSLSKAWDTYWNPRVWD